MSKSKMVKVLFEPGETGWAEQITGNLARIANIPRADALNIDDVVELGAQDEGGRPTIARVLNRVHSKKVTIWYDETWQFWRLSAMIGILNGKTEGGVEPPPGKRGFMSAAVADNVDPLKLAEGIGIENPDKPHRGSTTRRINDN